MLDGIAQKRCRALNDSSSQDGNCVIYWMSRDQRVQDNYALLAAQDYALDKKLPLVVVFNMFTQPTIRLLQHYEFMAAGLQQVEKDLKDLGIGFYLVTGDVVKNIQEVVKDYKAAALFCDFSPLREAVASRMELAQKLTIPMIEVDTNNVVPLWITSDKEEFAARTIRSKVHKHLDEFLIEPPKIKKHEPAFQKKLHNDWYSALHKIKAERPETYKPAFIPGEEAAHHTLQQFIKNRLENYNEDRNHPDSDGQSELSPYFHYGQLSVLRVNLEVRKAVAHAAKQGSASKKLRESADAFLEESIVRRELAQNYCYYNKNYTSLEGAKDWAKQTLKKHEKDTREYMYTLEELEHAKTHDDAWNASQIQMTTSGKMHGYMRMYWAKKIFEWSKDAETAIQHAVYLNDKYELDGYEANGYVGVMWSVAGIHDRPWFERPIYGQIRYMNYNGLKRKFDVEAYIKKWVGAKDRLF
jgi:deoxyribodipyrimidine photo-lyase